MPNTTPQAAGSGQPDQALRLVPYPSTGSRYFWAAHAVNDDTQQQVLDGLAHHCGEKYIYHLTLASLFSGSTALRLEAQRSFVQAKENGVLLFAWHGSSALEGGAA